MNQTDSIAYIPFYQYDSIPIEAGNSDTIAFNLDSVFASLPHPEPVIVESMFGSHNLQVTHTDAIPRKELDPHAWPFCVGIGCIILIWVYFRVHSIRIQDIFSSMIDTRAMNRNLREYNINRTSSLFPISLLWSTASALIIYYIVQSYADITTENGWLPELANYGILAVGCAGAYLIRNILLRIIFSTYFEGDTAEAFISSNYLFHLVESIVISTTSLFIFYNSTLGHIFLTIMASLVGMLYLVRLIREFNIFLTFSKTSKLHLFYYLCIVEFGPMFLILIGLNLI